MHDFAGTLDLHSLQTAVAVLIKLTLAALLGSLIGYERERHGRPAGMRTHMLVIIGTVLYCECSRAYGGDPGRIAAQVVTGVGFLGAGVIMRLGAEIRGLTTAASVWAVAAIGMCVSASGPMLLVAVFATALILLTLVAVSKLEKRILPEANAHPLLLEAAPSVDATALMREIEKAGGRVFAIKVLDHEPELRLEVEVQGRPASLLSIMTSLPGVHLARWLD